MKNILLIITALLSITNCASKTHPKMLSFTPASVVIDYSDNDLHEATALAQQFCSSNHKDAQYLRTEEDGLVFKGRKAFFNCVASTNPYNNNSNAASPIINNITK